VECALRLSRSAPEEIAEGLGITRFAYEHHGKVQSADVRLTRIAAPAAPSR
jgi:hypothetical protein